MAVSPVSMTYFLRWMYLLSLAVWLGSIVFFSFFAGPSIFQTLPKEEAGKVVSGIFPKYYRMGYACVALALVSLGGLNWKKGLPGAPAGLLLVMAAGTLLMDIGIAPRVRALKAELSKSRGETRPTLESRFKRWHGLSMAVNLMVLLLGIAVLGWTAMHLEI